MKCDTEERAWYRHLIAGVNVCGTGPELDGAVPWQKLIDQLFSEILKHDEWRLARARSVGGAGKIRFMWFLLS